LRTLADLRHRRRLLGPRCGLPPPTVRLRSYQKKKKKKGDDILPASLIVRCSKIDDFTFPAIFAQRIKAYTEKYKVSLVRRSYVCAVAVPILYLYKYMHKKFMPRRKTLPTSL
jgi:hypothetical protein